MKPLLPSLAAIAMASFPPAAGAQASAPVRFELPNGLRVWVQEDHKRPMVLVQTTYKVGSINDPTGLTGTAHYVEHMAYRATQNIRNEDIYGFVDRVGGRYTGGTAQLATTYTETVPSWALDEALRTNAERMGRVRFDSTEFERERTNVLTEANGYVAVGAAQILRNEVMSASFELHPYRQGSATWAADNIVVTRNQARDFYRNYYGPNNVVLAVVGDVTAAQVRSLVEKHFSTLARAPLSGAVTILEPPQRVEKRVTLVYPDDQSHLEIVYRAPQAAHADYPVLAVLDRILSERLRKAFVGSTATDITTSHSATPYPFVYRISATAAASADPERVVSALQGELDRLAKEGVAANELASARVEPVGGGRGGRGGRNGGGQAAGVPPRQSNLTQVATQLTNREVFPWDVSTESRDRIRRAEESVTSADIKAFVDHWLRPSMRTVGVHTPGPSNIRGDWATGREVVGERLVIPPLSTPPAKRLRPTPVPAEALRPLARPPIERARKVLANGVVVRGAHTTDSIAALHVRVRFASPADFRGKESAALLAALLIGADAGLQSVSAVTSTNTLLNDGYFDIRANFPASRSAAVIDAVAGALGRITFTADRVESARAMSSPEAGGRGGSGRGGGVAADARDRVLRAVAPAWYLAGAGSRESLARVNAAEVNEYLARHLVGSNVIVALVAPAGATGLLETLAKPFGTLPTGSGEIVSRIVPNLQPKADEERIALTSEPQVTVLAGLPGAARESPDARALELLNYIVGVPSYGGRLGWALTKTGLTYSSSATTTLGEFTGHILFSTKCDTRNTESTLQAIREVIAGVYEHGVEPWELREAQSFTLGRTLLYGPRDDSGADAVAAALVDSELLGEELLDLPVLSRSYLAVTPEQINAVARRYYRPELLKVVAIGAVPATPQKPIFPPGTFKALFEP